GREDWKRKMWWGGRLCRAAHTQRPKHARFQEHVFPALHAQHLVRKIGVVLARLGTLARIHTSDVLVEAHPGRVEVQETHALAACVPERMDDARGHVHELARTSVHGFAVDAQLDLALEDIERVDVLL